jgi:hypothetical protein
MEAQGGYSCPRFTCEHLCSGAADAVLSERELTTCLTSSCMLKSLGTALGLMLMDGKDGQRTRLGTACITPFEPVVAGSYGCWRLTYQVGEAGVAVGGGIQVDTDSDSDWGDPQLRCPEAADYLTVHTSGKATLFTVLEGGYLQRILKVTVHHQPLVDGDEITIIYGDRSSGGQGSRAQTFAEARRYFQVHVDASGDGCFTAVPDPPCLRVVGGSAAGLSVIAPSHVVVGDSFSVVVRAMDRFGNPSYHYRGRVYFEPQDGLTLPQAHAFTCEDCGVHRIEGIIPLKPGVYRIRVHDDRKTMRGVSNPIRCRLHPAAYRLYWGDLHGQVKRADKLAEYFTFPRDVGACDFASHQRNDHEVSQGDWAATQRVVKAFHKPGRFVVFLGYEWSGETSVGGDHNLYYLEDDQPLRRSGHELVDDKSDSATDLPHIHDVYRAFQGTRVFLVPHVGGRTANLAYHDPTLEPVIEVHSTHGTFEWFLREALTRGYTVGFIAGSDDYKLRLGGAYPGIGDRRFVRGGLTAIYARELTRDALFEAIQARRCYGTTGDRIILAVEGDGRLMGAEYTTDTPPTIAVTVVGTTDLETVEMFRGTAKIYTFPAPAATPQPSRRIKLTWGGASRRSPYAGVLWTGHLRVVRGRVSSPAFMPLDRGDERFSDVTEDGFSWRTFTCGDEDGACFDVEGEDAALDVTCTSTPLAGVPVGTGRRICGPTRQVDAVAFRVPVKELGTTPQVFEVGPVERRVTARRLPTASVGREGAFTFVDTGFHVGVNAYWVRVVQSDGEMAWSSPIYVHRPPERARYLPPPHPNNRK